MKKIYIVIAVLAVIYIAVFWFFNVTILLNQRAVEPGEKAYSTAYGETASEVKGLSCTYFNGWGTYTLIDSYDDYILLRDAGVSMCPFLRMDIVRIGASY